MRKNPFTVQGHISHCWLAVFRVPEEPVRAILPRPLEVVTHKGFAFLNLVFCELSHMRPAGLPAGCGVGYRHVAYRTYCRFGEEVEGLFFFRSDANRRWLAQAGNLLTDYRFHYADIERDDRSYRVRSADCPASIAFSEAAQEHLKEGSPFESLEQAERFLKYKPAGISVSAQGGVDVVRIQRDESAWLSQLVEVERFDLSFLSGFNAELELCYEVQPIEYRWRKAEHFR